jgi:hypothetical protein
MIFRRSQPVRRSRDSTEYRPLLRQDFHYHCAYCLTHEYFVGGEAGCTIDHHHPQRGPHARPDLLAEYTNLSWCCRECNENKGDAWPSPEEYARGYRFLDPCQPEDDHDHHWHVLADGTLDPLTPIGEYTIERLKLWRPQLQHYRAWCQHLATERHQLETLLQTKQLDMERRLGPERRLAEIAVWLTPPVFDRPRGHAPHA